MFGVILTLILVTSLIGATVFAMKLVIVKNKKSKLSQEMDVYSSNVLYQDIAGNIKFLLIAGALSVFMLLIHVFLSVAIIDDTEVSTRKCFGERDMEYMNLAGIHIVSPYCSYDTVDIGEKNYKFVTEADGSNAPMTADSVKMDTTVNLPVSLQPTAINSLLTKYKTESIINERVVENSYWDALRRAYADFYWEVPTKENQVESKKYLYIDTSRDELVKALKDHFESIVRQKLLAVGIEEDIANNAFKVGYPTISGLLPPDSISKAINEQKKANAELKRQATITAIEREKAKSGTEVGNRINNLLVPVIGKGHSAKPQYVVSVLNAYANLTRAEAEDRRSKAAETQADAIEKAVKLGNVNTILLGGDSNMAVPVK